ncbi:MAG: signal peptidase II [Alphaproteobacteria bacterium]|nr:signal peptidase II [Alphaproteobacteria bacterium]MDA7982527.1 signal peptidase II [Alphaproteobacteria bacterium]MDA7988166.1 signal peptidase II [Alphaproteobacteria bacterium]MDA7999962.1 signal peptidase II [Alphaproteobacteria bacterium]MDA8003404.1 signal peptidase II [Alphaproteobacteria bacterium]
MTWRDEIEGWQHRFLGAAVVLFLDQGTKQLALSGLPREESLPLLPFLSLTLTGNPGIAFSRLDAWGPSLLSLLSGFLTLIFAVWLLRSGPAGWRLVLGLMFIVGGAVGNLLDRLRYGEVIDFVHFHLGNWSFPVFNVADTGLTLGAVCLVWDFLHERGKSVIDKDAGE